MNKAREVVKRGANKRNIFQASNGGGDAEEICQKLKNDKSRGSQLISQLNLSLEGCGMGGGRSEGDEEVRSLPRSNCSPKRYKLHIKSFKNCDGVNHAAVPRKRRSAMDQRIHESLSPPSTKKHCLTSNGIEQRQIAKKSKQRVVKQGVEVEGPMKQAILDSMTKDEEEVAQTLFALAKMSPNRKTAWTELDERTPAGRCSSSPETKQNFPLTPEALEEESVKSPHSCPTIEPINVPSSFEGKAKESVNASSFTGPAALDQLTIQQNDKIDLCLGSFTALADCERSSFPCMTKHKENPTLANATSKLQLTRHEASVCKQNPESGLPLVTATLGQGKQQLIKGGDTRFVCVEGLWPSLPAVQSCGHEVHGDSARSSLTKPPAFLTSTATATRIGSAATILLEEKVQQVKFNRGNSWKKCAAHVYISQLIKSYQTREKNSLWQIPLNQNNLYEETNIAVTMMNGHPSGQTESVNMLNSAGVANSQNAVTLTAGTNGFATEKHFRDIPYGSEKMFQPEQLFSTTSVMPKEKQNCNLLSILARGGVVGPVAVANNSDNQGGTGFESSQVHTPYFQPIFQNNPIMPFPIPNVRYSSSPQVQLSQYVGSPSFRQQRPGHTSSLPQQQQQICSAQCRPGGMPWTYFPKWRNGRTESTPIFPCSQPVLYSSSPSEVFGAKFSPVTEQQQIFAFSFPTSSSRGKMLRYPLPSSYDASTAVAMQW